MNKVQQQLKRWYTLSCAFTLITFIMLTSIHTLTLIKLQQLPPAPLAAVTPIPLSTTLPTSSIHDQENTQAQEIATLIKKQQSFLPMLTKCIEALPESIQINKLFIEPTARIEYTGSSTDQAEIAELLDNLQKTGYQEIIKLDIKESFHLILNVAT